MVGNLLGTIMIRRIAMVGMAVATLAACDENGQFLQGNGANDAPDLLMPANAPNQTLQEERDIERPDIFSVNDSGIWDGRPSLGGVWVAHPDATDPERVLISNTESGQSIIGALFRRERENPGPLLQVSSDAAEALGILPGAPTRLSVVALRREEVEVIVPSQANPVVADLEAPVNVETAPLAPVVVSDEAAAAAAAVVLPPAVEAATAAVEASANVAETTTEATALAAAAIVTAPIAQAPTEEPTIDVSSILNGPQVEAPADGPRAQIGVFSVEANANQAVATLAGAGIAAQVLPEEMGGNTVWRVIAGPLVDETVVAQLKALGFVDAFIVAAE